MRFYRLSVSDRTQTEKRQNNQRLDLRKEHVKPPFLLCSYVRRSNNGPGFVPGTSTDQFDPGALDIQFQITQTSLTTFEEGGGDAAITIRGVDISTINQASNLVGKTVSLQAGMGKGLPLSNPKQIGEILRGTVRGSVGNWVGTDLSLTLYVANYVIPPDHQATQIAPELHPHDATQPPVDNYQFHCTQGGDLVTAVRTALSHVNPTYKIIIDEKGPIPCSENGFGMYRTFKDLCVAIGRFWYQQTGNEILITAQGDAFRVMNQARQLHPIPIRFEELIGQPSWNGPVDISFTCPMRGDIQVGDIVQLPNVGSNAYGVIGGSGTDALYVPKSRSLFSGNFYVGRITHLGQFRSPDGQQWATTFHCWPAYQKESASQ